MWCRLVGGFSPCILVRYGNTFPLLHPAVENALLNKSPEQIGAVFGEIRVPVASAWLDTRHLQNQPGLLPNFAIRRLTQVLQSRHILGGDVPLVEEPFDVPERLDSLSLLARPPGAFPT
jgi:hypothetical protein